MLGGQGIGIGELPEVIGKKADLLRFPVSRQQGIRTVHGGDHLPPGPLPAAAGQLQPGGEQDGRGQHQEIKGERGPGRQGPGTGQEPGRQGQAEADGQPQAQVGIAAHQEELQQHDPQGRAQGLQIVGPPRGPLGSRVRQDLDRAGEKVAGNQPGGGQQEQKEQEGGGQRQGLAQGQVRQTGEGPRPPGWWRAGAAPRAPATRPAGPAPPRGPRAMQAAARQAAQPGPQEPAPQPQGQLQLLALGQDQQLPEDQHLGDHGPGPEDQDRRLGVVLVRQEVQAWLSFPLVPKLYLGTKMVALHSFIVPKLHLGTHEWRNAAFCLIIQPNQSPTPHPGRGNFERWNSASLRGGPLIQSSRDYSEYNPASVLAYLLW